MIHAFLVTALVGATLYTGSGPPIENATVILDGNRVQAVGRDLDLPAGAEVIDVRGKIVTPGLIDAFSRIGVSDVSLEESTVEATLPPEADPVRASLLVADTYDPHSLVAPVARRGGITSSVVVPSGGIVSGLAAWVDLIESAPVRDAHAALVVGMARGEGAGGRASAFLRVREAFGDARLYRGNRGPFIANRLRSLGLSAQDLEVVSRAVGRELLVIFAVNRATDIRTVLEIADEYDLDIAIAGGAEGWLVADALAAANVPVFVDPFQNLPSTFDKLHARADNAARLHAAGVPVVLSGLGASHLAHRLRQAAGNAVAAGLPYDTAIASITSVPARVFGMVDAGELKPGALANLVVWTGDPLEVTTWAERVWIRGREIDLTTRQDRLAERYAPESRP